MYHLEYPPDLPISARRSEILAALREHQVLILAGETGSGKTTQIPKFCLEAGLAERGRIGCTQPRRVAALSVSRRVAEELRVTWGREVGCKVRFADDTAHETRLKFMTDGILLAEIQSDPLLRAYSTIILDEAHERSLNIDFLLGYFQELRLKRPELKLVITSATIDTEVFSQAFGGAPIIEVSGRLYPVEVRYAPPGEDEEEDPCHLQAAVRATEEALIESHDGDVLIFMPTERDIRETCELLEGALGSSTEVLPLFGRMSSGDQQRIFAPGARRRVIVATNIAETSLTLPRIRYVVDSGLSRVSRYQPRTRTKRLPVEPISQSSAQQRTGRAGRVQAGVCIRLYSEEDFAARPRFSQPEIQRANLAEVILRMKAWRLGEIETFPFLQPPPAAAIRAGYGLLHELGTLSETNELTPLGRELARLPLDPTLGRMLLQAREEGAVPEVLVLAAGLSVPDPRERPEEQREAAATAHKAFADADSDFLTLLNIWYASPSAEGRGSTNALRRFCKANFLSFVRMREWRDVHRQLADTFAETPRRAGQKPAPPHPEEGASYAAIHRAVLAGLLGQIAQRKERNTYQASGNRLATLFPGSSLYERAEKRKSTAPPKGEAKEEKVRQPAWIVAGEVVETSQLFARTAAAIDPEWVVELGAHLCRFRYTEPHWSAKAQRVLALERVLIHGLEVTRRQVDYGRVEPAEATELFIRGALVAEEGRIPLRFFAENRRVRDKVENALTRVRSRRALDLEEALFRFYRARLEKVSSVHDLNQVVRERIAREPDFLCATEADLLGEEDAHYDRAAFPDQVSFGQSVLPLAYAYSPGEENDGVTVRVPLPLAEQLTTGQLQWMVPGLRAELAEALLRALPKSLRKTLMPLEPKVQEIAREFAPGKEEFLPALAQFLRQRYRAEVRAEDWPPGSLPAHLQPRLEVVDPKNRTLAAGRDLAGVRAQLDGQPRQSPAWEQARQKWERTNVTVWDFGELPESVTVEQMNGVPLLGYPALAEEQGHVAVRLFRKASEAAAVRTDGVRRLGELVLARDLARAQKELLALGKKLLTGAKPGASGGGNFQAALQQLSAKAGPAAFTTPEALAESGVRALVNHLLTPPANFASTPASFQAHVAQAQKALPGATYQLGEWARQILALRAQVLAAAKPYPGLPADVHRLVPPDFLSRTPWGHLPHLLRYLRAVQVRAERYAYQPAKDVEKARQLAPFAQWEKQVPPASRETFRWLLEEFRVSLFAQELGTAQPASAQRLQALLDG